MRVSRPPSPPAMSLPTPNTVTHTLEPYTTPINQVLGFKPKKERVRVQFSKVTNPAPTPIPTTNPNPFLYPNTTPNLTLMEGHMEFRGRSPVFVRIRGLNPPLTLACFDYSPGPTIPTLNVVLWPNPNPDPNPTPLLTLHPNPQRKHLTLTQQNCSNPNPNPTQR